MKVLFLVSGNNKLGVSPFIESQADSLLTLGIDLKIFKVEGKGLFSYFKAVFKLRKILSIHNFDLIHCHYGLCGWVWFFGARKIPSVLSLMGSDVYGTFENKNKNFTDYFLILSTKLICFFVSHIIVKSKNLYHDLPSYVTKKTSIIPNGVNFSKFLPIERELALKKLNLDSNKKYLLFLGNPKSKRKNFNFLFDVFSIAKNNISNLEILAPYPVSSDLIPYYMAVSELLIMPSLQEGSPNVVKESLACNLKVLVSDVGDVRDHIDNLNFSKVLPLDKNIFSQEIQKLINQQVYEDSRESISYLKDSLIALRIFQLYQKVILK